MKRFFGVLAVLSFFFMLGTVGAMEQDMIGLGEGVVRAIIALGAMALFAELAGASDYTYTDEEENRRQEWHSHRR